MQWCKIPKYEKKDDLPHELNNDNVILTIIYINL